MQLDKIEKVYTGKWISLYKLHYNDGKGHNKIYEMVSKSGTERNKCELDLSVKSDTKKSDSIAMAVFNKSLDKILLCKEFRMGVNEFIYNFPAGLLEPNESIESGAKRELQEETGLNLVKILKHLQNAFTCAPVTDEITDLLIVIADGNIVNSKDINEEIYANWYSKSDILSLIDKKEKFASRTQAFCYMWAIS